MADLGIFAGGLSRGIQSGVQLRTQRQAADLNRERFDLQKEEFLASKEQAEAELKLKQQFMDKIGALKIGQQGMQQAKDLEKAGSFATNLRWLSTMPKSVRAGQVDAFVSKMQQSGVQVAPNFVSMLKQGSMEDLKPFIDNMQQSVAAGELGFNQLMQTIGDPSATADAVINSQKDTANPGGALNRQISGLRSQIEQVNQLQLQAETAGFNDTAEGLRSTQSMLQKRVDNLIKFMPSQLSGPTQEAVALTGVSAENLTPQDLATARLTGRQQDVQQAAATTAATTQARLGVERQFSQQEQVSPAVSAAIGVPGLTKGQAQQAGISEPQSPQDERELGAAFEGFNNVLTTTNQVFDLVEGNPDIVGASGSISRIADTARTQAMQIASSTGIPVNASTDPSAYKDELQRIGVQNEQLQAAFIDLAFAAAIASGQTGKGISDTDVTRFLRTIGAGAGTKEGLQQAMMGFLERADNSYRSKAKTKIGIEPPKTPYGMSLKEIGQITPEQFQSMAPSDQRALRMRIDFLDKRKAR